MVRSQLVVQYLLPVAVLLLSACSATDTAQYPASGRSTHALKQNGALSQSTLLQSTLLQSTQHDFENLLARLRSNADVVNASAASQQNHHLRNNPLQKDPLQHVLLQSNSRQNKLLQNNSLQNKSSQNDIRQNATPTAENRKVKNRILQQYDRWKGVRYHLGGDTHNGVDCSAFVQRTFLEQFGMELPRSTAGQRRIGERIPRSKLRSGDLVLFKAGSTGSHVGIYIGNNQFVHASVRRGVIISSMDNPYWKPRYREARRILITSDS